MGNVFADGDEDVVAFVLGGEPRNGKQHQGCKRCKQPFHRRLLLANTEPKAYLCERMDVKLVTVGRTDVQWVKDGLERGKEYRSVEWADWIRQRLARGGKSLVFVIGGAYGFSKKVYDRAEGLVSLSRMTFSHQMVRTIFAEQLYRAFTIIKGEPYHHE